MFLKRRVYCEPMCDVLLFFKVVSLVLYFTPRFNPRHIPCPIHRGLHTRFLPRLFTSHASPPMSVYYRRHMRRCCFPQFKTWNSPTSHRRLHSRHLQSLISFLHRVGVWREKYWSSQDRVESTPVHFPSEDIYTWTHIRLSQSLHPQKHATY